MKCDQCDQEATVHELRVVSGKKVERHLCERCARKQGIATQPQASPVSPEMIEKYMQAMHEQAKAGAAGAESARPAASDALARSDSCPSCGTGFMAFRQSGLLGCPECYRAFEGQLGPLLERAHQNGTHHVGKIPSRALGGGKPGASMGAPSAAAQRATRIARLQKLLDDAVQAEHYEKAAELRDELRALSEATEGKQKPV